MARDDFFIYGRQPVYELLRSDHRVNELICAYELETIYKKKIKSLAENRNIKINYIAKAHIQRYCGPVVHQGVAAKIDKYKYISEKEVNQIIETNKNPIFVILDQIQDPHNLGAIIRTAEVIGVTAIILPEKGSASINNTVAKTSSGAIFHCKIHLTNNLLELINRLKKNHINICAMLPGQEKNLYKTDLTGPLTFIFGSEGEGVRKNLLKYCDYKVSIPQIGKLGSLNVSVTAAIVLFETLRQRNFQEKR